MRHTPKATMTTQQIQCIEAAWLDRDQLNQADVLEAINHTNEELD